MKRLVHVSFAAMLLTGLASAQAPTSFKLGTFERAGRPFVGVVLRDSIVIDLGAASSALKSPPANVAAPADMKDLIARYDAGVRDRIVQIVGSVNASSARPGYVYDLKALKTLPPIVFPTVMLNVALNYVEHSREMAGLNSGPPPLQAGGPPPGAATKDTTSIAGIWDRQASDGRWNPYMFLKSPSAVVADGEPIRLPVGRDQIDWECELGVVIGRPAARVPVGRANEFIFGYTLENDVSDRGGRGDSRYGSDWVVGKSHDTFAPLGPFIVPKEFVADPRKLKVTFTLNGQVMQDADTSLMIHDVFEQVAYASHIMTLRPGDVIATGSPAGVGSARKPPVFFKAGDVSVCTYEGVGTLTNPVVRSQ
jgi:2-keto-4-pentenoate hydratase/2-oxohepta-3-ene-1,7-dioic acid hydratase in catechol pathway